MRLAGGQDEYSQQARNLRRRYTVQKLVDQSSAESQSEPEANCPAVHCQLIIIRVAISASHVAADWPVHPLTPDDHHARRRRLAAPSARKTGNAATACAHTSTAEDDHAYPIIPN